MHRKTRLSAQQPSVRLNRLPKASTKAFVESWEKHKFADHWSITSEIAKDLGLSRAELLARLQKRKFRIGKYYFFPAASRFDANAYLEISEVKS
jgi:hypothetical protein